MQLKGEMCEFSSGVHIPSQRSSVRFEAPVFKWSPDRGHWLGPFLRPQPSGHCSTV